MNIITNHLVTQFLQSQELNRIDDARDFEKFSAYSVIRKIYGHEFNLDDVLIGGGGDLGIDALAIIVNGALVTTSEEIDDLIKRNKCLDITYVFIQAKSSEKFENRDIATFCRGVVDFFTDEYNYQRNDGIVQKKELHEYLLNNAEKFRTNPKCLLYYVSTGIWDESRLHDQNATLNRTVIKLKNKSLFSDVMCKPCGASEINALYKESCHQLSTEIYFSEKTTLSEIPNVRSAYIGILRLSEFKKLIIDDNNCVKNVFEDNVRDFQDLSNPVNKKIDETLEGENYQLFPLLNNGITIVADKIQQVGNKMIIFDYQIVNGCQTSNILAKRAEEKKLDSLSIPVKIIETADENTKHKITIATNNQTPVKKEQLEALSNFQRTLEDYYNSLDSDSKLVYERRANQYAKSNIPKARIISISNQIKSFAAMFLRKPHRVNSYYGELTERLGNEQSEIFNPQHLPLTYYLAGLSFYRLESLFRNGTISPSNKKFRYYILMGFLVSIIKEKFVFGDLTIPKRNEKKLEALKDILADSSNTALIMIKVVDKLNKSNIDASKEGLKLSSTVELVCNLFS